MSFEPQDATHTLGSHRVYIHGIHKIKSFVSKGVTFVTQMTKIGLKMTNLQSKHVAYVITLCNKVVVFTYTVWHYITFNIDKLTVSQLLKNLQHFIQPEGSLPHSQQPVLRLGRLTGVFGRSRPGLGEGGCWYGSCTTAAPYTGARNVSKCSSILTPLRRVFLTNRLQQPDGTRGIPDCPS